MKHVYLTHLSINEALQNHAITYKEAQKLQQRLKCQEKIAKAMYKH